MLKVDIDPRKDNVTIIADGSTADIMCDIATLINRIFWEMHGSDPVGARAFKAILARLVGNEGSPVWARQMGPNLDNPEREDSPWQ